MPNVLCVSIDNHHMAIEKSDCSDLSFRVGWSKKENHLYFLVDITDDYAIGGYGAGTAAIYNYDIIEVFLDENRSKGLNNVTDPSTGKILKEAVNLRIGNFVQTLVDFSIIAFSIFMVIKGLSRMKEKKVRALDAAPPPTKDQELLMEIRDLLKK